MSDLKELDSEFTMTQQRMWLFPDMLGAEKVKGFITSHEIKKTNDKGEALKKPMLVLNVDLSKELENKDFPYREFRVSFWTLHTKGRDMSPSELIKTNQFEFFKDGSKIGISENSDIPYVETIDV